MGGSDVYPVGRRFVGTRAVLSVGGTNPANNSYESAWCVVALRDGAS